MAKLALPCGALKQFRERIDETPLLFAPLCALWRAQLLASPGDERRSMRNGCASVLRSAAAIFQWCRGNRSLILFSVRFARACWGMAADYPGWDLQARRAFCARRASQSCPGARLLHLHIASSDQHIRTDVTYSRRFLRTAGLRHTKTHTLCRRCGKRSFHKQKSTCSSCGYPASKIRKYNWSVKAIRRKTTGTGRMRYLKVVQRKARNNFQTTA